MAKETAEARDMPGLMLWTRLGLVKDPRPFSWVTSMTSARSEGGRVTRGAEEEAVLGGSSISGEGNSSMLGAADS